MVFCKLAMTSICDTASNSSRVILDSNSGSLFDLEEISDDVVEVAGDVLANKGSKEPKDMGFPGEDKF